MKYFFIVDDSGNAIYFNHPYGTMIALPFALAQMYAKENFGDSFTAIDCADGTKLAFDTYESLSLLVVSDEGENEAFLRSQLNLARELLFMEYSPALLTDKAKIISGYFQKPQIIHRMTTIIDTMCYMCSQKQSFLVQSIEELLGHSISSEVKESAVQILKSHLQVFPQMQHAFLFVGTKLLAEWRRPKARLSSKDMFLLILFYCSHFHPKVLRRVQSILEAQAMLEQGQPPLDSQNEMDPFIEEQLNEQNRQQHLMNKYQIEEVKEALASGIGLAFEGIFIEVIQVVLRALGIYSGKTDGFFSTDLRDAIYALEAENDRPQTGQLTVDVVRLIYNVAVERQEKEKQRVAQSKQLDSSSASSPRSPSSGSESVFGDIAESTEVIRLVLTDLHGEDTHPSTPPRRQKRRAGSFSPDAHFSPHGSTTPTSPSSAAAAAAAATSPYRSVAARSAASPRVLDATLDPLEHVYRRIGTPLLSHQNEVSHEEDESSSKLRAKLVSRVKSMSPPPLERLYQQVYLSSNQHQPRSLYCTKLHDRMTLVVITSNSQTSEAERQDLIKVESAVRDSIMENYASYLLSVENSFTMISYMHQLPGLVHFIFVDRTANRILAPGISSLIGNASKYNTALGREQMLSTLKSYIWQMCYQGYESLCKGFFDMVMKYGEFQFSYKLWFEDLAGNKVPVAAVDHEEKELASDSALGRVASEDAHSSQRSESPARRRRHYMHSHVSSKEPIARDFYKKLQKTLFPQGNVKCFELYCLYIGSVSLKIVDQNNSNLIALLNEKRQ